MNDNEFYKELEKSNMGSDMTVWHNPVAFGVISHYANEFGWTKGMTALIRVLTVAGVATMFWPLIVYVMMIFLKD